MRRRSLRPSTTYCRRLAAFDIALRSLPGWTMCIGQSGPRQSGERCGDCRTTRAHMRVARAAGVTPQSRRDLPLVAVPPRGASADRSGLRQLADLQSGGDSSAGGLRYTAMPGLAPQALPDLRECLETGGLRHSAGRCAERGHQREYFLQPPAGLGGILSPLNGGALQRLQRLANNITARVTKP